MPDSIDPSEHVKPFVHQTLDTKTLQFSISEIQSRMQTLRPDTLELAYTRTMMAFLLFKPEPQSVAMIGLGGGSLAKFCYRHLPTARIKVVEINPHVIALRDTFCVPPDDRRFTVRCGDGADFVKHPSFSPEVLLVDGFDAEGQPPALCSQTFYDNCLEALAPGGLMVVNLHSAQPACATCIARIERAFGHAVLVVSDVDCSNTIVFASKDARFGQISAGLGRKPRHLDRQAWAELAPARQEVIHALKRMAEVR
jgi:spermidine synthase